MQHLLKRSDMALM